jgi:hypothetical protein
MTQFIRDILQNDISVNGTSEVTILEADLGPTQGEIGVLKFWAAGHSYRASSTSSNLTFRLKCGSTVISSFSTTSTSTANGISFTLEGFVTDRTHDSEIWLQGGISVHTGLTTGVAGDGLIQKFTNSTTPVYVGPSDGGGFISPISLTVQPSNSNFQCTFRAGYIEQIYSTD